MKAPPKISVIIPLYNCAPWISQVATSLQAQTCNNFECLLIDDCGPDREGIARAEDLTRKDPRFRLIRYPRNRGLGDARNIGVAHAKGVWLAFMDQDDLYYPDAFRLLLDEGERTEADVVEGKTLREPVLAPLPDIPRETNLHPSAINIWEGFALATRVARMYLAERDGMHLWNRLYRRAWWGDRRLDTELLGCDDALFCAEYLWTARRLVSIAYPTYRFSITPDSQSANLTPRWMGLMCRSFIAVWQRYTEGLLRVHPELTEEVRTQLRWVLVHWIIYKCWHRRKDYDVDGRKAIAEAIRSVIVELGFSLPLKARWRLWYFFPDRHLPTLEGSTKALKRPEREIERKGDISSVKSVIESSDTHSYDVAFSLGNRCACAIVMRRLQLRLCSGPFDWVFGPQRFLDRVRTIETEFQDWMNPTDMVVYDSDGKTIFLKNTKTKYIFLHDFPASLSVAVAMPNVQERYRRRQQRFFDMMRGVAHPLLIWYNFDVVTPREEIEAGYRRLEAVFGRAFDLLMIEHDATAVQGIFREEKLCKGRVTLRISYLLNYDGTFPSRGGTAKVIDRVFEGFSLRQDLRSAIRRRDRRISLQRLILRIVAAFVPIRHIRRYIRSRIEQI